MCPFIRYLLHTYRLQKLVSYIIKVFVIGLAQIMITYISIKDIVFKSREQNTGNTGTKCFKFSQLQNV